MCIVAPLSSGRRFRPARVMLQRPWMGQDEREMVGGWGGKGYDNRGPDADWFRQALAERAIAARIPSKSNRKKPIRHDRRLHRQRHEIEKMLGRLKDWRRIHIRYDRCAHAFMSAICTAVAVIFWL
jgi:hypothetical protein